MRKVIDLDHPERLVEAIDRVVTKIAPWIILFAIGYLGAHLVIALFRGTL